MKKISQICNKYWRQMVVIVSLTILCLYFSSCKKKHIDPPPTPTCETGTVLFAGRYENTSSSSKTFTIEFLHNNCPTENSNTYLIRGFGDAVKTFSAANKPLFTANDYTVTSDEPNFNAHNFEESIQLVISNNVVTITSTRLKGTITFIK